MALKDRTDLFTVATVSGNTELDWLSSPLMTYTFQNLTTFTVPSYMVGRLDLVSFAAYGVPDFWWLIGIVNNIMDPFDDMSSGQVLKIPSLNEYFTFYNQNVGA